MAAISKIAFNNPRPSTTSRWFGKAGTAGKTNNRKENNKLFPKNYSEKNNGRKKKYNSFIVFVHVFVILHSPK